MEVTMTRQTTTTARYEQLLDERIRLGRLYVDTVSHGEPYEDALRLYNQMSRLDQQLDRYRRYACDEYRLVMTAENERWHVPGQPPTGSPECGLCIKHALAIPRDLVLRTPTSHGEPLHGEAA
jgi:hypothetical protein